MRAASSANTRSAAACGADESPQGGTLHGSERRRWLVCYGARGAHGTSEGAIEFLVLLYGERRNPGVGGSVFKVKT